MAAGSPELRRLAVGSAPKQRGRIEAVPHSRAGGHGETRAPSGTRARRSLALAHSCPREMTVLGAETPEGGLFYLDVALGVV